MKISPEATKGHMIVGAILVFLSLASFIVTLFTPQSIFSFLIFFFGVWGGVETGRYMEFSLKNKSMPNDDQSNG